MDWFIYGGKVALVKVKYSWYPSEMKFKSLALFYLKLK